MEKTVVKFIKPFGAYAKGDRAGFDADFAQHLRDLGVAKPDTELEAARGEQEHESAEGSNADAADEQQPKPAGKAPRGAKA